ncbi:MAG TPA: hypothetical protein VHV83_20295, partial [Armatimonadota bacterium]|nr:hypothetical protein [Armatimonadota bacterium]
LAAIVSNGYLNNGRTAAQEFDSLLSSSAMDNAVFMAPEIIRFYAADRAFVRLGFRRTDGVLDSFTTVAKNFGTASAPSWKLYGNQRHYNLFVNAVADKRNELNPNATLPSSYNTGLNLYLDASAGSGPNISYAVVKGPGLPTNGVVLKPSTGTCSYLTIVDNNGNTGAAQRNSCTSFFRMAGVAQNSTATYSPWGSSPNYAPTMVSDTTLQAIKPFDAYVFDIVDNANNHTYLVDRLQAQPVTVARLPNIHYNVVADATKALLIPGTSSSFAGGSSIAIGWVPQPDTALVHHINVQFRPTSTGLVTNDPPVPRSASVDANGNLLSSATFTVNAPGNTNFPAATAQANGFNFVELSARTPNRLQIFGVAMYSNF